MGLLTWVPFLRLCVVLVEMNVVAVEGESREAEQGNQSRSERKREISGWG
jgi:hypothetical protein